MSKEKLIGDLSLKKQVAYLLGASQIDYDAMRDVMRVADGGSTYDMRALFEIYENSHVAWQATFIDAKGGE